MGFTTSDNKDKSYYIVPDVTGKSPNEATKDLKPFKVEYSGNGDKVLYQSPSAGSEIVEGEIVRLLLTK